MEIHYHLLPSHLASCPERIVMGIDLLEWKKAIESLWMWIGVWRGKIESRLLLLVEQRDEVKGRGVLPFSVGSIDAREMEGRLTVFQVLP